MWRRFLLPLTLCACVIAQTHKALSPSGNAASVQGTVLNQLTGKPLDAVHVMLVGYNADHTPAIIYGAMTNAAGHFSIAAILPDEYSIMLERRGFIFAAGPRQNEALPKAVPGMLNLKSGEQLEDVILEMTPRAIISGRVVDEYGDPVMNVNVIAVPLTRQLLLNRFPVEISTNDRGEFRLSLPPGRYYIKAFSWSWSLPDRSGAEIRTDGTAEASYVETYYPGTAAMQDATRVEAAAGQERSGIEIQLARKPVLSISGTVSGFKEGTDLSTTEAQVTAEWGPDAWNMTNSTGEGLRVSREGKLEGKFQLGHLNPGVYRVYAHCRIGDHEMQSQPVDLTLSDSNVEGLNLVLAPGFEVAGTIEFSGNPQAPKPARENLTVQLHPAESLRFDQLRVAGADAEGRFRIKDVFDQRYRVEVAPLPDNGFVKTVSLNGTPVADGILDFSNGSEGGQIKITLSTNAAGLLVRVQDSQGQPASSLTRVMLAPDLDGFTFDQIRFGKSEGAGLYHFQGLAPGYYRIVATEGFGGNFMEINKALRDHTLPYETVELKEGEHAEKTVKLPAREETNGQE